VKVDNCFSGTISPKVRYPVMRDALNATGSPIFYSMCEWGLDAPWLWAKDVGNSWRTTGDISDSWDSMTHILDLQTDITKYAGPGGWNDMDMLEVGNGGMTFDEYKAHFSLWSLLKSPLLIGADITKMTNDTQTILFAREVIAVNQDALGVSGSLRVHHPVEQWQIWAGPLEDGSTAFVLFNRGPSTRSISVNFSMDLGVQCPPAGCSVRCLWFRKTFSQKYTTFTIPVNSHGVFMGRVFA
jgi:alpha-galactosidase